LNTVKTGYGSKPRTLSERAILFPPNQRKIHGASSLIIPSARSGDLLKETAAARHIEQLRFSIEAYRLEQAVYPQSLDAVSRSADPWGRPYVYRVTEASFSLFSAGADGTEHTADDIY